MTGILAITQNCPFKKKKKDAVETFSGEVSLIKCAGWRKRG